MSGLKTILFATLFLPVPVAGVAGTMLETFAACTGRYSAELDHAYLMNDPASDEIGFRRRQFVDLFDAAVPSEERGRFMGLRIQAKFAHAGLLTQATFSGDEDRSDWARRRAQIEVGYCASLLLKG